jgi:hypothetical protein
MSSAVMMSAHAEVLTRVQAAIEELQALDLTRLSEEDLLEYWRELERARRRLPTLDHALVLEAEARGLPESHQVRSSGQLLRRLLRLDPGEAAGRVRAAQAAGVRRAMTGQPLPPAYPVVAAAQAEGLISERHARVITETIEKLPDEARHEHGGQVETDLVDFATRFDPHYLAKLAHRISAHLDPDGTLKDAQYRERHRDLTPRQRPDGSGTLSGELSAELMELLLLHFDAFAAPRPEAGGVKDTRTAGQRRHDALLDALKLNVRARQLPTVAGVTATLVLTMTQQQYETGQGLVRTAHGAHVPASEPSPGRPATTG